MSNWRPYSVRRLVRMVQRWRFRSEFTDYPDDEDCAPFGHAQWRRVRQTLMAEIRPDDVEYDSIWDDEQIPVRVGDLAYFFERCRELERLEDQLMHGSDPECTRHRFNKKTGKMESWGAADDYGPSETK
jgi:hypothetical protein